MKSFRLSILFTITIISSCVSHTKPPLISRSSLDVNKFEDDKYEVDLQADLIAIYKQAVEDARHPEEHEVYKSLKAINSAYPKDSAGRILVIHWANDHYLKYNGRTIINKDYTWVTLASELEEFCRNFKKYQEVKNKKLDSASTVLRLKQLTGLPPTSNYTHFLEILVYPKDLIRPCPDPEISDCECETSFRESSVLSLDYQYIEWFKKNQLSFYPNTLSSVLGGHGLSWVIPMIGDVQKAKLDSVSLSSDQEHKY